MAPDDPTPAPDVLSSLPRTRPQRRSAKRDAPGKAATATKPRTAPRKPAARRATAAPKKAAAPRRTTPKTASAHLPPAGFAPPRGDDGHAPSGTELVGTAIQAAGELAQIGLAVGGQALRSALGRLGRS
jgi:hypothetical protein